MLFQRTKYKRMLQTIHEEKLRVEAERQQLLLKQKQNNSAVKLQSVARMKLACLLASKIRLEQQKKKELFLNKQAVKIQSQVRMLQAVAWKMKLKTAREIVTQQSCIKIQSIVRMRLGYDVYQKKKQLHVEKNAIRLQSFVRMYQTKLMFTKTLFLHKQQIVANGFEFALHKYLVKVNAINMLKKYYAFKTLEHQIGNAIKIQSAIRQFLANRLVNGMRIELKEQALLLKVEAERKRLERYNNLRTQNAIKIQTQIRMHIAKQHMLKLYIEKYNRQRDAASIKIQSMYRRHKAVLTRKHLKESHQRNAAIVIQCFHRRTSAMRQLDDLLLAHLQHLNDTAIKLQCHIRRFLAICQLEDLKSERDNSAAVAIQRLARQYLARCTLLRKRKEKYETKLYNSSTKIQTIARGFMARQHAHHLRLKRVELKAQQQRAVEALAMIKSGHKWGQARKRINARRKQQQYQNPKPAWGITNTNNNNSMGNFIGGNSIMGITPTRPTSKKNININIGKSPREMKVNHTRHGENVSQKSKLKTAPHLTKKKTKLNANAYNSVFPKIKRPIIGNSTKSKSAPAAIQQSCGRTKIIATTKLKLHSKTNKPTKKKSNNVVCSNKDRSPRVGGRNGRTARNSDKTIIQQNSAVNWFS
eukprot:g8045.t1